MAGYIVISGVNFAKLNAEIVAHVSNSFRQFPHTETTSQ